MGFKHSRDCTLTFFRHLRVECVVLFPYVCIAAGRGWRSGDAVELPQETTPAGIGKAVVRLLRESRRADIEKLKAEFNAYQLRCQSGAERGDPFYGLGPTWQRVLTTYPALGKGPGTFLRQFVACEIIEATILKSYKLCQIVQSKFRGLTTDGNDRRVPKASTPTQLGQAVFATLGG